MTVSTHKFAQAHSAPVAVTAWTDMSDAREYIVGVLAGDVSPRNGVTVQLRKATSSGGANAANWGSAVTADDGFFTSGDPSSLGEFSAGVPFTHVSAIVTDQDSPNTVQAIAFKGNLRNSP